MISDSWNRPVPPDIMLCGQKRFDIPLADPTQCWVIPGGRSRSYPLGAASRSDERSSAILIQAQYSEGFLDQGSPGRFSHPPTLDRMSWDWIEFHCRPLEDLEVKVDNWVPDPRVICSRHILQNRSPNCREITLDLICKSESWGKDTKLSREDFRGWKILSGKDAGLNLIVYLSGSEVYSGGPSSQLKRSCALEPLEMAEVRWILVLCDPDTDPRQLLEETIKMDWDGEIARRRISLSNQLQIKTGNTDRDFALAFSQRQAQLFLNQLLLQMDSRDSFKHPLEPEHAWQLFLALSPLDSPNIQRLLAAALEEKGKKEPPFPVEAELLWHARQAGISPQNLAGYLPGIEKNLASWFSRILDKDGDGVPEEPQGNLFQLVSCQQGRNQGSEAAYGEEGYLENPGLAALLHNEIRRLTELGDMIPGCSASPDLNARLKTLERFILESWCDPEERFQTRDFQSHTSNEEISLAGPLQNGWNVLRIKMAYPSRISLRISGNPEEHTSQQIRITLQGFDRLGRYRIEELTHKDFRWKGNAVWGTTQSNFTKLDYCAIVGLELNQSVQVVSPLSDRQDLSLLLPFWMDNLPPDMRDKMASRSLGEKGTFQSDFGLKSFPFPGDSPVQLPLNLLVIQGLIKAGHSKLAGEILIRLIDAASHNILHNGHLYGAWDSGTGSGLGKPDPLTGTLPVRLFLDLLGVRLGVTGEFILEELTPFLFPVQLIYKGTEITIQERETAVRHRSGDRTTLHRNEQEIVRS